MKTLGQWIGEAIGAGLLLAVGALLLEPKLSLREVFGLYLIARAAFL